MSYSVSQIPSNRSGLAAFPLWVLRPIGVPINFDNDWFASVGNKYGIVADGTGTVAKDTAHFFGMPSSMKLTTDAVSGHVAEFKIDLMKVPQGLIAFEGKFINRANNFGNFLDVGFEVRSYGVSNNTKQARFRFSNSSFEWTWQKASGSIISFIPPAISVQSSIGNGSTSGDFWNWFRLVIDTVSMTYKTFEFNTSQGIVTIDMTGLSIPDVGFISGTGRFLAFNLVVANSANAVDVQVTDWCLSYIPT